MKNQILQSKWWLPCLPVLFAFTNNRADNTAEQSLFKITRNKDANELFYQVNKGSNGVLNMVDPVSIHWIKHTKGGKREGLSFLEKKYAYGLRFIVVKSAEASFQFVSYSKKSFTLKKNKHGSFKVFTKSKNKEIEVRHIHLQLDGGSFLMPKITKIILNGSDAATGTAFSEVIIP
ncbi:MAG: DUF4833 domain-containing protein [Bacteroidota bacterium]